MNDRNGLLEELGECKILDVQKGAKRPGPSRPALSLTASRHGAWKGCLQHGVKKVSSAPSSPPRQIGQKLSSGGGEYETTDRVGVAGASAGASAGSASVCMELGSTIELTVRGERAMAAWLASARAD